MKTSPKQTQVLADQYDRQGNPNGWFEAYYQQAEGDIHQVHWADLAPGPCLVSWIKAHPPAKSCRAAVIGCGLGDDAEFLASAGCEVTAFDISPTAIAMCRERWPDSNVTYVVGDLFAPEDGWISRFDVVYECNTIQALRGSMRSESIGALIQLLAPGGYLLVSCRSREDGVPPGDQLPIPLNRAEIGQFVDQGLTELQFDAYDDDQAPPVPHFFAVYRR
jgi:SAM-dependent methyltransferase